MIILKSCREAKYQLRTPAAVVRHWQSSEGKVAKAGPTVDGQKKFWHVAQMSRFANLRFRLRWSRCNHTA
jgi:hypothetical protein